MWADEEDTMIIPGPERARVVKAGSSYWISCPIGLVQGTVVREMNERVTVRWKEGEKEFHMSDCSFYDKKPR